MRTRSFEQRESSRWGDTRFLSLSRIFSLCRHPKADQTALRPALGGRVPRHPHAFIAAISFGTPRIAITRVIL